MRNDDATRRLVFFSSDHGLTTSFDFLGPDGNNLEPRYDNFGDWALSTELTDFDVRFPG